MTDPAAEKDLRDLIARTALGDRSAFSDLYRATSAKLFGVTLRLVKERAQAEDALQEVYVKIWQRAGSYAAGDAAPMAWLVAIARNHSIDVLRARRPDTVEIDDELSLADTEPDPEANAVNASEGRRIERCLRELDDDRAKAVVGAYVEGLSYLELAERHDVPLNTMRTWLRRSLLKLKECLER